MHMELAISPNQALRLAVEKAGGQSAFARAVGCTPGAVWQMLKKNKELSPQFVLTAEAKTGVSRHDLRPDLYPRESGDDHATPVDLERAR